MAESCFLSAFSSTAVSLTRRTVAHFVWCIQTHENDKNLDPCELMMSTRHKTWVLEESWHAAIGRLGTARWAEGKPWVSLEINTSTGGYSQVRKDVVSCLRGSYFTIRILPVIKWKLYNWKRPEMKLLYDSSKENKLSVIRFSHISNI